MRKSSSGIFVRTILEEVTFLFFEGFWGDSPCGIEMIQRCTRHGFLIGTADVCTLRWLDTNSLLFSTLWTFDFYICFFFLHLILIVNYIWAIFKSWTCRAVCVWLKARLKLLKHVPSKLVVLPHSNTLTTHHNLICLSQEDEWKHCLKNVGIVTSRFQDLVVLFKIQDCRFRVSGFKFWGFRDV